MNQLEALLSANDDNLLTLLSSLCQGSIAIDQFCKIVWISDAYREFLALPPDKELRGVHVEEILPSTQLPRVVQTGQPSFLDLMQINNQWCAVTRLPLKNPDNSVFGAIGFIFYHDLDALQPLFDKFARLRKQLVSQNLIRTSKYALDDLIGQSEPLLKIKRQALRAAQLDTTVLLLGETGTGKELLAQGIHNASPRSSGPFVGINMAALPESLVEAELFGAAAGAYTGASRQGRQGKIQLAEGGTLFLDEIADISPAIQAKLLRVIQEREVEALGSNRLEKVDVRIIAATSRNLKQQVDQGLFRADLYYRLNVLPLNLPPLRVRSSDIPSLSHYLLDKIQQETGLPPLQLSPQAIVWLQEYHWPGNVRELHNRLERACVMAEQDQITADDLGASEVTEIPLSEPSPKKQLHKQRDQAELSAIHHALQQCQFNKTLAAEYLGISRATLYNRLKRLT
ncbi:sigma-54 interaction domain-containing protein [Amphritea balenae]|uniref:AAA family ATPase n=1 Tax=Amphritea balenae TaxID=452629 RepID=A0A3P1SRA1_9GAMM|nr:sigma 54-interacting transcriptional regulator [Amphritea balenae]RRC99640.1 AAA family ATPase [Amphritea balenae]GGK78597.1 sigma-54-dependent Fis family transcriptional regulator [Amphritea balenae]